MAEELCIFFISSDIFLAISRQFWFYLYDWGKLLTTCLLQRSIPLKIEILLKLLIVFYLFYKALCLFQLFFSVCSLSGELAQIKTFDFYWMMIDIFDIEICIEIWTEKGRHLHSLDLFDFLFGHKFSLNIFKSNFGLDKSDFLSHKNKLPTHLNSQKNSRCL